MSETVWTPYSTRNMRLVGGCYHYDAAFECECPNCGYGVDGAITDMDTDAYGMITQVTCPSCGKEFWVNLESCLDNSWGSGLSVDEAAQIWASNGRDEDYMFGYSVEELEDAL